MGTNFTHHLTLVLPHRPSQLPPPSVVAINNAWIVLLPALAAMTIKATAVTARPAAATRTTAAATMMTAPVMAARRVAPLPLTRLRAR